MTFVLTVLGIYWAVLFSVEEDLEALKIAVVSFDGQFAPRQGITTLVRLAVIQTAEIAARQPGRLGFTTQSLAKYNNDPMAVRCAVYNEQIWAAIIVNNNAVALLQQAVATGNAKYDPLGAAHIIYIQAVDQKTYGNNVVPVLTQLSVQMESTFGQQWIANILSNTSLFASTYSQAPQALNPAIGF